MRSRRRRGAEPQLSIGSTSLTASMARPQASRCACAPNRGHPRSSAAAAWRLRRSPAQRRARPQCPRSALQAGGRRSGGYAAASPAPTLATRPRSSTPRFSPIPKSSRTVCLGVHPGGVGRVEPARRVTPRATQAAPPAAKPSRSPQPRPPATSWPPPAEREAVHAALRRPGLRLAVRICTVPPTPRWRPRVRADVRVQNQQERAVPRRHHAQRALVRACADKDRLEQPGVRGPDRDSRVTATLEVGLCPRASRPRRGPLPPYRGQHRTREGDGSAAANPQSDPFHLRNAVVPRSAALRGLGENPPLPVSCPAQRQRSTTVERIV